MKRIEFEDALVVEPAKVSVLDEMPVGTVVDFDGEEIPAGWEKVEATDDYSTEETFTGKYWIDGKKIYSKTINLSATTETQTMPISNISSNISSIWIDLSHSFYGGTSRKSGIISDWDCDGARFKATIDTNNLYYVCSSASYTNGTLTLEYTKTTE